MDLILIILFLLIGIGIGSRIRLGWSGLIFLKPIGLLGLILFVFLLGIKIGHAPQVRPYLTTIGLQGLLFAGLTVFCSMLAALAIRRFLPEIFRK